MEHGAAQRQSYGVDVPGAAGQRLREQGGSGRAGEREPHVLGGAVEPQREDGYDDRETGARVDAEGGRRGEWIAGDALGDGPGDPERGADREADDGPRQAQPGHHEGLTTVNIPEQCVGHRAQGYGAGAEGETQGGAEGQGGEAGEEERYVPEGTEGNTGRCARLDRSHKP